MICPNCNKDGRFATVDSRHREWGVKRVRVCPNCGKRVATIEIYKVTQEAIDSLAMSQYAIECRERDRKANEDE